MSLLDRLNAPGPKRLLALDGGGVRGAITLGYLKRLETILIKQHNNPDFRLSDYFDLVGGTSTGSILASCIALGMKVDDIKVNYFDVIYKIFGKKYSQWNVVPSKGAQKIVNILFSKADYDSRPIEQALQNMFKDITLGSDAFKSGLCIVAKRADTNSTWPLLNHPGGKYFNSADGKNSEILLWKAVRASAAAPTYFIPQVIDVGGGMRSAAFVDGGMTMANNPCPANLNGGHAQRLSLQVEDGGGAFIAYLYRYRGQQIYKAIKRNIRIPGISMGGAKYRICSCLMRHGKTGSFLQMAFQLACPMGNRW